MFQPTIPFGEPELIRVSEFVRYLHEPGGPRSVETAFEVSSRPGNSLSPSLLADLSRFEQAGHGSELLEVLAACIRHAQQVAIHLQMGELVVPLTVFPLERLVHCPVALEVLLSQRPNRLRVLHVEPAVLRPPGDPESSLVGEEQHHHPLRPVLWELALRGSRVNLLPEIAGPVAYRVAPGLDLTGLRVGGSLRAGVRRLRQTNASLRDLCSWPGFNSERASRLLNALYLQSGLIVSRTHPAASAWFSGTARH